jgi:glycosyltransferase involved in cell wall biosynthesis
MNKNLSAPAVSIIVPTYNRSHILPVALDSIAKQTFMDYEVIVVNDAGGSVSDIIRGFSNKFSLIYIEHETNKGMSAARNTGLGVAKGKYIAYLDDDDMYYPNHLETLVGFLESSDRFVAYSDSYRSYKIEEHGQLKEFEKDMPYSCDFDYERIFINNFIPVLCLVHRKSCLENTGFFDENLKRFEDWDMVIRLSINYKLFHINKITCEFTSRSDGKSMTSSNVIYFWESRIIIYDKYKDITISMPNVLAAQNTILSDIIKQFTILGENFINIDNEFLLNKIFMLQRTINSIKKSKDYKLGYYMLTPLRIFKNLFKTFRTLLT